MRTADRTQGIIDRLAGAENYDAIKWILQSGVTTNYTESVVDAKIKANCDFQGRAGLTAKVERVAVGKTCKWCQDVAGEYVYPNVPADVWRRHERCNCIIKYTAATGREDRLRGSGSTWFITDSTDPEAIKTRKNFIGVITEPTPAELEERKTFGINPTPVKPQEAPKAVLDFEKKSRKLKNERAIVTTQSGDIVTTPQGKGRRVHVPTPDKEGYILSHNHPADVTFSVADISGFEKGGYKQVRAVSSEKTYILEAINPKKLTPEEMQFTDAMGKYWAKLDEESAKRRKQINETAMQIQDRVERSAYAREQSQLLLEWRNKSESEWLYKNAKKYGYIYWEESAI